MRSPAFDHRRRPGSKTARRRARRAGLAPLELVLTLPLLLFVMALMINFGNIAAWKLRGQTAARYASYRTLNTRTGDRDPNPRNWPAPATIGAGGGQLSPTVANGWRQAFGGAIAEPVGYRGAISGAGGTAITVRDKRYLEMGDGLHTGTATIQRSMPLLPNMSDFRFDLRQNVVVNQWRYYDIGVPNTGRRIGQGSSNGSPPGGGEARGDSFTPYYETSGTAPSFSGYWYDLETLGGQVAAALGAFQQADQQLQQLGAGATGENLVPLDRDPDFMAYRGSAPDFHYFTAGCENIPTQFRQNLVQARGQLLDRLKGNRQTGQQGMPCDMKNQFLGLYRSQQRQLQQQLDAMQQAGGGDPDAMQGLQGEINRLQQLIDQLNEFDCNVN